MRFKMSRAEVGTSRRSTRVDLDDQHVFGRGVAKEREDHRIAHVAAVPVRCAIDRDGLEQHRQRGRCHHDVGRDFLAREDAQPPGRHIGGGDEQLHIGIAAHRLEIDEALDHILERIDVEGIEIVGRKVLRHRVEPGLDRRALKRHEREQALHDLALAERQVAVDADRAPEIREPLPRLLPAAACHAVGQHHGIQRARRSSGQTIDDKATVFQEIVEHAPGKRARARHHLAGRD